MEPVDRLKDDKAFLLATGIRLEDEAALVAKTDLSALRQRTLDGIANGATGPLGTPSPPWGAIGMGSAVLVATIASVWLSVPQVAYAPPPRTTPPIHIAPLPVPATPTRLAAAVPSQTTLVRGPAEPIGAASRSPEIATASSPTAESAERQTRRSTASPRWAVRSPRRPQPAEQAVAVAAPERVAEPGPAAEPAATATAPPTSTLAEQLKVYDSGRAALKGGKLAEAEQLFSSYLKRFPGGELTREARLSLLETMHRAGKWAKSAALSRSLVGSSGRRKGELWRMNGEALSKLKRCDEAAAALAAAVQIGGAGLSAAEATRMVDACRGH